MDGKRKVLFNLKLEKGTDDVLCGIIRIQELYLNQLSSCIH